MSSSWRVKVEKSVLVLVVAAVFCIKGAVVAFGQDSVRHNVTVTADASSATAGIQEAVNALGRRGGVISLRPGEYVVRQSIYLGSNVTLQGAGDQTVLRKTTRAESKLAGVAARGSRSVQVENSSGFRKGDGVAIRDKEAMGWNVTYALVTGVQGNELLLDRPLPRPFDPEKMGFVIHAFSALTANNASNIVLKDLTIVDDSGRDLSVHAPASMDNRRVRFAVSVPFPFAAIHLVDARNSRIAGCRIVGWLSDGISIQRGANNVVARCVVEKCGGNGFHPGGGLQDSEFSENVARGNGGDGLYFCARVERVVAKNNTFVGNQQNGIGGLGDAGDKHNVVENNLCEANGACGISLWDGESNTVKNNTCVNNSQASPGKHSGILISSTSKTIISGNRCLDSQKSKTQRHGIEETAQCRANVFTNNDCQGNSKSGLSLAGRDSQQVGNVP